MNPLGERLMWRTLVVVVVALLVAVAAPQGAPGAAWTQRLEGDFYVWYRDEIPRFRQSTWFGWWQHNSDFGGWWNLDYKGSAFIGDGAQHDLWNGFSYRYTIDLDCGYYLSGGSNRFYYRYGVGQWYHGGYESKYRTLGNAGLSSWFVGDGLYHALGGGFYYRYDKAAPAGHWSTSQEESGHRFCYWYGTGQWQHRGYDGTYYNLGNAGQLPNFMGNGIWYDLGTGFKYRYNTGNKFGYFALANGTTRFYYDYSTGRWYHGGYAGAYRVLGNAGLSVSFLGDGAYHTLGGEFSYRYDLASSEGFWTTDGQDSGQRFAYWYGTGQWQHRGYDGTTYDLGNAGQLAAFIADGILHDLGNGFKYRYNTVNKYGYFALLTGTTRFYYNYSKGQWYHGGYNNAYRSLGNAGLSADFVGDASYHALGNGWWYRYDFASSGLGYWTTDGELAGERFFYSYGTGQWQHRGYDGAYQNLGNAGLLPGFMGDGILHDLGNGFKYRYNTAVNYGYFTLASTGANIFEYVYGTGRWYHAAKLSRSGWNSAYQVLSNPGMSAAFIGDGNSYSLGTGWTYRYEATGANGYFSLADGDRFYLDYTYDNSIYSGWWFRNPYYSASGSGWTSLGGYSSVFIGNGQWHATWLSGDNGSPFGGANSGKLKFRYAKPEDRAYFATLAGKDRFYYNYALGQWYHTGDVFGWYTLGGQGIGVSANPWNAGGVSLNGFPYLYVISQDVGNFGSQGWSGVGITHFTYNYGAGQWSGGFLGSCGTGFDASFIADGVLHDLGNGWQYRYVSSKNRGAWFRPGDQYARYEIDYATWQWWHGRPGPSIYKLGKPYMHMDQFWSEYRDFIADGEDHIIYLEIGGRQIHYMRSGDWGIWYNMSSYPRQGYTYEYDYLHGTWYKWDTYYQEWVFYKGPNVDPYFNPNVPPDPD